MKYFIAARARSRSEEVEKIDDTHFRVSVKEPPVDGRANFAIERVFAKYLGVPATQVKIVRGHVSRSKIVEVA